MILILILTLSVAVAAAAQDATEWQVHEGAKTRLIAGVGQGGQHHFAWEIELEDGWKTYWRTPGQAGLPPRLNFDGSENLAVARPEFPLPERFDFFGIESYGYAKHLVLPVKAVAEDPARPLSIQATVDFMVCKDLCIPYTTDYQLTVHGKPKAPFDGDIMMALMQVPDREGGAGVGLDVGEVKVRGPAGNQRLSVVVESDRPLTDPDILVEADAAFGLSAPQFALLGDGTKGRFVLSVDGGPEKADLKGQSIILTVSDGAGHAVERSIQLDN